MKWYPCLPAAGMLALFFALFPLRAEAQNQPAFPGAEGFGMYTTGGRGGQVIHVTTLEDGEQEGTFRYACTQKKYRNRTIVFDVSGTIHLNSQIKLSRGDVTIAGQTAPGDGICIADYPFVIAADNVIIRYMRFRLGNKQVANHEGDGLGGMDRKNIIIDHCSVSWSVDECLSVYGCRNLSVQWCLVAQSMVNSGHSKGSHGYGGNWGGSGASYHHNLMAHHVSRVPRLGPRPGTQTDERMDLRNNVFYNWAGNGCYGGEGMNVNIVNNYYKPGPGTFQRSATIQKRIAGIGIRTSSYTKHDTSSPNDWDKMWHVWGKFYVDGNVNPSHADVTRDNWTYGIYNQISNSSVDNTFTQATMDTMRIDLPIAYYPVTTQSAEEAYRLVLEYAGASLHRDQLDALMVDDTKNGKASYTGSGLGSGFINTQDDVKDAISGDESPWPSLASETAPTDTDQDGMPDEWELANGLDPNNAADGKTVCDDGYTNLEHYLNGLVAEITAGQQAVGVLLQDRQTYAGTTGIDVIREPLGEPVGTAVYSPGGMHRPSLGPGVNIVVKTYANGQRNVEKVVVE